jgi:hypothetical protein
MAANAERLAELAEKGGYKNWAAKWRRDAELFREAGGPEFFDVEQPTDIEPTLPIESAYRAKTSEEIFQGIIEELKEDPTIQKL